MAKLQMKFEPWCCQSFASTDESKRADGEIDRPTALLGPMVKNKQILADYMIQEETKNQEKFMLDSNLQPLACKSKRSDHSAICPIDEKRGKEENVILTPRADDAGFEPKPLAERPMAQMNLDCAWNLYAKGAGLQERVKRTLFEENIKPNMEKNTYQVDQDIINGKFLPPINEKTVEVDRFKKEKICIYRSDSNPQPLGQQSHSLNKLANSPIEEKKRTYAEVVKARPVAKMLMRPGLPPRYAQVDQISYSHPEACLAGRQDRQLNRIDQKFTYQDHIADREERLNNRNKAKSRLEEEKVEKDLEEKVRLYPRQKNGKQKEEKEEIVECSLLQWLRQKQQEDDVISTIIKLMKEDTMPVDYNGKKKVMLTIFKKGLIFNKAAGELLLDEEIRLQNMMVTLLNRPESLAIIDGLLTMAINGKHVIVVPLQCHYDLIFEEHEKRHGGMDETVRALKRHFYIYDLKMQVMKFIDHCRPCQLGKRIEVKALNPLGRTTNVNRLECWCMDLLHMPVSKGPKYLLTIVDTATKWLEAYPLTAATEQQVIKRLDEFLSRFNPKLMISDLGPEFKGKTLAKYLQDRDIQLQHGIARYSNDKMVERFHVELNKQFRVLLTKYGLNNEHWTMVLNEALKNIRNSIDKSSYSAYERVYGQAVEDNFDGHKTLKWTDHNTTLQDNEDDIVINQNGTTRRLNKLQFNDGKDVYFAEVYNIHHGDDYQLALEENRQKQRDRINRDRPNGYIPIIHELVDIHHYKDDPHPSKKLTIHYTGPLLVIGMESYKVYLQEIDPISRMLKRKRITVSMHQVRPTTYYSWVKRTTYCPPWKMTLTNGKAELCRPSQEDKAQ